GLEVYKPNDRIWRDTSDLVSLENWDNTAYATNNFPFEQAVDVSFSGAVTPENATFGTIPVPYSASQQGVSHLLPSKPSGVMVSWTGPQYSTDGIVTDANSTERKTCMQYAAGDEPPTTTDDCVEYIPLAPPDGEKYDSGQMYTAPWETDDGVVTLSWKPNTVNANETVSISVRFLGEIDETKDAFVEEVIPVQKTSYAQSSWDSAINDGEIPAGTECPEVGYRAALPCDPDEEIEYIFDDSLRKGSGYISSLQGDPTRPLVEVTCNVEDNGSFEISEELLSGAMDYARQHNAQGAVFYINRTTTSELSVPDVRDRIGSRRVTGPILVSTNAVQFGRFWYNPSAVGGE
ncbi:MAG: hypothetical protein VX278_18165, partial [Myxococcota bacterium]|nr:hypothetical protein [Myxococcota bacterium]